MPWPGLATAWRRMLDVEFFTSVILDAGCFNKKWIRDSPMNGVFEWCFRIFGHSLKKRDLHAHCGHEFSWLGWMTTWKWVGLSLDDLIAGWGVNPTTTGREVRIYTVQRKFAELAIECNRMYRKPS